MAIQDYKVSEAYSGRDISSLSDRPNQDGMSASQLKARFDQLGKEVIPNYNDLIDFIKTNLFSGGVTNDHTHNVDNLVDGTVNRNYTQTDKTKLDDIEIGAEVNQNAFSSIKVGGSTGNANSKTATFEIVAGLNIVASIDPLTNKVTLSATGDISTLAIQSLLDDIGNYYNSLEVNGALQEIGAILYPSLAKTTPVDADTMLIVDTEASSVYKKITWASIKSAIGSALGSIINALAPKTTPVDNDMVVLMDSASSNGSKKLSWANIKTTLKSYFDTLYQAVLTSGTTIKTINETSVLGSGNISVQPTLVSGTNIKTINGNSVLGSGDLPISSGSVKNQIINGNFQVNQRAKTGTVTLTAGQYGHDRWKAGASGCTYTFATVENITTLTISAGSLIQFIEGLNLETGTYCLSWEGTSQGKIGAGSYGASGITGSAVGGTNLNIEFNTGTLKKVSFVKGSTPAAFVVQPYADVLIDCQRYYQRFTHSNESFLSLGSTFNSTVCYALFNFKTRMRTSPVVEYNSLILSQFGSAAIDVSSISLLSQTSVENALMSIVGTGFPSTPHQVIHLGIKNVAGAYLSFSAEL